MTLLDTPVRTITSARVTVTSNGTRVQLSTTNKQVAWVVIAGLTPNTNAVTWGGVDCVGAAATRVGQALNPGQQVALGPCNLASLYVDSITNGEGVNITYGEL